MQLEASVVFKHGVSNKTVLDIGAWNGYFSFQSEQRGAKRVLATDHFCWSGPGWGAKEGFDLASTILNSNVESMDDDVANLNPEELGRFDIVLFLGVLYHLEEPYTGLKKAAAMCSDLLVVETETAYDHIENTTLMRFFLGNELGGDPTNFWASNKKCLENMLKSFGFSRIEFTPHPIVLQSNERGRYFVHAFR